MDSDNGMVGSKFNETEEGRAREEERAGRDDEERNEKKTIVVGVVGTGLSGLSLVHLLSRHPSIEIHLFEKEPRIGIDAHSDWIPLPHQSAKEPPNLSTPSTSGPLPGANGKRGVINPPKENGFFSNPNSDDGEGGNRGFFRLDSPMRALQGGSHTTVLKLFQHFGIPLIEAPFDYSFFEIGEKEMEGSDDDKGMGMGMKKRCKPLLGMKEEETRSSIGEKPSSGRKRKRTTKTKLLYNGSNGLSLNPISIPSHILTTSLKSDPWISARYLLGVIAVGISYIVLVLLALVYPLVLKMREKNARRDDDSLISNKKETFSESTGHAGLDMRSSKTLEEEEKEEEVDPFTVSNLLRRYSYYLFPSSDFVDNVVIPLFACVCTASRDEVGEMGAGVVFGYVLSTFGAKHYVAPNGIASLAECLLSPTPTTKINYKNHHTESESRPSPYHLHLGEKEGCVREIRPESERVEEERVRIKNGENGDKRRQRVVVKTDEKEWTVDHLVFALPPHLIPPLLQPYLSSLSTISPHLSRHSSLILRDLQSCSAFTTSIVVNHTDWKAVLPEDEKDWRALNIVVRTQKKRMENQTREKMGEEENLKNKDRLVMTPDHVMATHILSKTHPYLSPSLSPRLSSYPSSFSSSIPRSTSFIYPLILQTTNPTVPIDPNKVISTSKYERALVKGKGRREAVRRFGIGPPGREETETRRGWQWGWEFLSKGSRHEPSTSPIELEPQQTERGRRSVVNPPTSPSPSPSFSRPKFSTTSNFTSHQGFNSSIWFCGSWLTPKDEIPLLETCLTSARTAAGGIIEVEELEGEWKGWAWE